MIKSKVHILEISKWMLFFESTIVAKTGVTLLQSPSPFIQCWSMGDWCRGDWIFRCFAALNWGWGQQWGCGGAVLANWYWQNFNFGGGTARRAIAV